MFKSMSTTLLWRGLLAVAIGIVSIASPNITVGAFVILFAVYAFLAAGSDRRTIRPETGANQRTPAQSR